MTLKEKIQIFDKQNENLHTYIEAYRENEVLAYNEDYEELFNKRNAIFLTFFEAWLKNKGLTEKTIRKHLDNLDLYLNYHCFREGITLAENCYLQIDMFFFYTCPSKLSASRTEKAGYKASIRKFLKFLKESDLLAHETDQEDVVDNFFWG